MKKEFYAHITTLDSSGGGLTLALSRLDHRVQEVHDVVHFLLQCMEGDGKVRVTIEYPPQCTSFKMWGRHAEAAAAPCVLSQGHAGPHRSGDIDGFIVEWTR